MKTLERAHIPDLIGRQWFFVRVYDAVQLCKAEMMQRRGAVPFVTSAGPSPSPPRDPKHHVQGNADLERGVSRGPASLETGEVPVNLHTRPWQQDSSQGDEWQSYEKDPLLTPERADYDPTQENPGPELEGGDAAAGGRQHTGAPLLAVRAPRHILGPAAVASQAPDQLPLSMAHLAPDSGTSQHLLYEELDAAGMTDSNVVPICTVCNGLQYPADDGLLPHVSPQQVLAKTCRCTT